MLKVLTCLIFSLSLYAKPCASYFNPNKFYEAPLYLQELIDENLKDNSFFGDKKDYKSLNFKNIEDNLYINEFIKQGEYKYPKKSGLFSYKIKDKKIDEFEIAIVNLYKYSDIEIAEEINNDFEGFWNDWNEDAYEMSLIPQEVLFKYKDKYFTLSVFIYGVKKDATKLKGTSIKFWFKDYTKQVNKHIQCLKNLSLKN